MPDNYERTVTLTAINNPDSDGDLVWDGGEDPDGDKLSNIAEMKGRPATSPSSPNSYVLPKKILVYYGYPSAINGSANITNALTHFKEYDYVVLAGRHRRTPCTNDLDTCLSISTNREMAGLEEAYANMVWEHHEHQLTKQLLALAPIQASNTMFFGYIALGTFVTDANPAKLNYSAAEIQQHIDWWKAMKVDGIFFDEFGFDYMTDKTRDEARQYQNVAVDKAHAKGFPVIANGWVPLDVLGTDPTNGLTVVPRLGQVGGYVDFYFYEDHQYQFYENDFGQIINAYVLPVDWKDKAEAILRYQTDSVNTNRNFHVLSITTTTLSYAQAKFWYSWHSAFLYGHEATGWGEPDFSADGTDSAPLRARPSITDAGTLFATAPSWSVNTVTRYTDGADGASGNEGRIRVNAGSPPNSSYWSYPEQAP